MNSRPEFGVVSIHGVPRSGTSWLGQIFNSHPDVAYRHQPLFSHRFKDAIGLESSDEEVARFFRALFDCSDDDFIADRWSEGRRLPFDFKKSASQSLMVMKMVRYHHLIRRLLQHPAKLRVVGIVRHPCAVIHSWSKAPKEFDTSWTLGAQWQFAEAKNQARPEEFYGVEKWLELAELFLELEKSCDRFALVRYEELVTDAKFQTRRIFDFCGLEWHPQVSEFLAASQSTHSTDPYAITKRPATAVRWQEEMDDTLIDTIMERVQNTAPGQRFT